MVSKAMSTFFQSGVKKTSQVSVSEFRSAKIRICACVQTGMTGKASFSSGSIQTGLDCMVNKIDHFQPFQSF